MPKQKEEKQKDEFREIVIKTDGDQIEIEKAEVSGSIELRGILTEILRNLT